MAQIQVTPKIGGSTPFAAIGSLGPPISTAYAADLSQYEFGILSCDLAGSEEVDIVVNVGGTWKLATDVSGTAQKLTASIPSLKLEGGICYGVLKDQTVADTVVYLALGPGLNG